MTQSRERELVDRLFRAAAGDTPPSEAKERALALVAGEAVAHATPVVTRPLWSRRSVFAATAVALVAAASVVTVGAAVLRSSARRTGDDPSPVLAATSAAPSATV